MAVPLDAVLVMVPLDVAAFMSENVVELFPFISKIPFMLFSST